MNFDRVQHFLLACVNENFKSQSLKDVYLLAKVILEKLFINTSLNFLFNFLMENNFRIRKDNYFVVSYFLTCIKTFFKSKIINKSTIITKGTTRGVPLNLLNLLVNSFIAKLYVKFIFR